MAVEFAVLLPCMMTYWLYTVPELMVSAIDAVGSHLSELQLSEHVGYLNAFSKATPTISGYFRRVSGLALPVV